MLPILDIALSDLAETGFNPALGGESAIGDAFHFQWDTVIDAVVEKGWNLDHFLTARLLGLLARKKPKSSIIVFYAPAQNHFTLTICSRRNVDFFPALHMSSGMPGYLEFGQNYVSEIAQPFILYSAMNCYRVYVVDRPDSNVRYISDFGNLFGLLTTEVEKETYNHLLADPSSSPDYSAVPQEPTTMINIDGRQHPLQHAFIRLGG
jgi:hypothetical protein